MIRRIFSILFFIAFLVGLLPGSVFAYPAYTANSGYAHAAPYGDPILTSGGGSLTDGTNGAGRYFLTVNNKFRIRQSGTVTRVAFYANNAATNMKIQVWRKDGSTYDLVGESEDFAASVVAATTNTITLATPITGVQEGDYYAIQANGAGSNLSMLKTRSSATGYTTYFTNGAPSSTTDFAWESATALASTALPVQIYMNPPQFVFIGDSIIAGHPAHYSFLESTSTTSLGSTIEGHFSTETGYTYQNMGIGGQDTTAIVARFTQDVIDLKPKVVVLEGGVNDLADGDSQSTFIANMTTMLDAIEDDANIGTVYVLKILPWTSGTNLQMQTRDTWNSALETLVDGYTKAVIVDANTATGLFRSGGDPGNLWDIQVAYNADGVHFTSAGHSVIADQIIASFDSVAPTITSVTSTTTNGTYAISEQINITVNFSEPVNSTGNVTVTLETGATDRTCTFTASNVSTASCTYTVQAGDSTNDLDVASISGTISDISDNAMVNFIPATSLASAKALVITSDPKILSITSSDANGTYYLDDQITLSITFSESVTSSGSPYLTLETGDVDRRCSFTVTASSSTTCVYTVQNGDVSSDLTVTSFTGTIVDAGANALLAIDSTVNNLDEQKAIAVVGLPEYAPNASYAKVAPYDTISTALTNISDGASGLGRYYITIANHYKIRQSGTIEQVRFYASPVSGTVTIAQLQIWRKDGSTYDLVGQSEDFGASVTEGTTNTITLSTPITGVQEGDYVGFYFDTSAGNSLTMTARSGVVNSDVYFTSQSSAPTSTNFDWTAQTNLDEYALPVEVYMDAPVVVLAGDSQISGEAEHKSYLTIGAENSNPTKTIGSKLYTLTNFIYQNMGVQDTTSGDLNTRFTEDVIDLSPSVVVIHTGTKDIDDGVSQGTFIANIEAMLTEAQADADIDRVVLFKILPWTSGSNVEMQTRDTWNEALDGLVGSYSKLRIVDARDFVGEFRAGGDAGNLWNIQSAYSSDGVNFNEAGNAILADVIYEQGLQNAHIQSAASDTAGGTYGVGDVIDIDITFSDHMTSTGNVTVTLETGATDRTCTFTLSDARTGTCNYTVQSGDVSSDLSVNSITGTINAIDETLLETAPVVDLDENEAFVIDGVAPVVSNTSSSSTGTTITLSWDTDEASSTKIEYGATSSYGSSTTEEDTGTRVTSHDQTITGLTTCTTYHIRAFSEDGAGNVGYSSDIEVTTTNCDSDGPIITSIGASAATTTSTISWTTDEAGSSQVDYGLTNSYGSQTVESDTSPRVTSHSVSLSSLDTCTTYHYRVRSKDALLNTTTSSDNTFTTTGCTTPSEEENVGNSSGSVGSAFIGNSNITNINNNNNININNGGGGPNLPRSLSLGMTGDDVRELQRFLNRIGFTIAFSGVGSSLNETNYFGLLTRDSVIRFQKANNIDPIGIVGPVTRNAILNFISVNQQTSIDNTPIAPRNLSFGMRGLDVKNLQIMLNSKGFTVSLSGPGALGFETDYFGQKTVEAVKRYQVSNGLNATGIADISLQDLISK
jgi:lysophospholipase L1-like esterase/peptidoglycan hydrolase-like protein with peptidoglycan-binding domain